MEAGGARARSAAGWLAAALAVVVVTGVVYLHPSLPSRSATSTPAAAPDQELMRSTDGGAHWEPVRLP
jgi:hypothetical protein